MADLHCNCCNNLLGWKYSWAEEESQKYKVSPPLCTRNRCPVLPVDSAYECVSWALTSNLVEASTEQFRLSDPMGDTRWHCAISQLYHAVHA